MLKFNKTCGYDKRTMKDNISQCEYYTHVSQVEDTVIIKVLKDHKLEQLVIFNKKLPNNYTIRNYGKTR